MVLKRNEYYSSFFSIWYCIMLSILWKLNHLVNSNRIKLLFFFFLQFYNFSFENYSFQTQIRLHKGKSGMGISSIIYLILGTFNILSYHKLLTQYIKLYKCIKYLSQQLRSSYNVRVLGSKSYRKLIINYVITYLRIATNLNLKRLS